VLLPILAQIACIPFEEFRITHTCYFASIVITGKITSSIEMPPCWKVSR
jgi:hypothetical protein